MKKHHRPRTENFPRAASFQLPRQNLSFLVPRFLPLFQIAFSRSLSLPLRERARDMDENAELANFPQKCSFPADGLSPLADTSSTAGANAGGDALLSHRDSSSRLQQPPGARGKSCENFFVNSEKSPGQLGGTFRDDRDEIRNFARCAASCGNQLLTPWETLRLAFRRGFRQATSLSNNLWSLYSFRENF